MKNYNDNTKFSDMLKNRTCDNMDVLVTNDDQKNVTGVLQKIDDDLSVAIMAIMSGDGISLRAKFVPPFIVDESKENQVLKYINWSNMTVKRGWMIMDNDRREVYMDHFIAGGVKDDLSKDTLMKETFLLSRYFVTKIPDLVSINDGEEFDYEKRTKERTRDLNGGEGSSDEVYIPKPDLKDQMFG